MKKTSTTYVYIFVVAMTVLVALLLAGVKEATQEQANINENVFNKRAVLAAVAQPLEEAGIVPDELADDEVLSLFEEKMQQEVLDVNGQPMADIKAESIDMAQERKKDPQQQMRPLYILDANNEKYYILSVRGNGLWDEIWGYVALESDLNTIAGASFDHKGETPGLGAEIKDNPAFAAQFIGKKIYRDEKYVSVLVRKGGAKDDTYEVDGLSGATITADGVTNMLYKGIQAYEPYLEKQREEADAKMSQLLPAH
ncbi:MAG: NADH:ubiquinone reductase (Na(+)-transporting) subunit C [Saprospiraceae bacterium]